MLSVFPLSTKSLSGTFATTISASVSADAISNQQTGEQYYVVDVSMNGTLYEDNGDEVVILPGMVASIDVLSGKRTILDYFWQPISKTRNTAFRE